MLERAYRNYYYYKYVPGYGGYSYYTTCMLDVDAGGTIVYNDLYPAAYDPGQAYVVSLTVDGHEVDFHLSCAMTNRLIANTAILPFQSPYEQPPSCPSLLG